MEIERRDLSARAARDRLAELTSVSPRDLGGLDARTAGTMTRAILYPDPRSARARHARQMLMQPARRRSRARVLGVLIPLPVLLLTLGVVFGDGLRARLAPAPPVAAATALPTPAARAAQSPAPSAAPTAAPAAADPVAAAGLQAIAAHLGAGANLSDPAVTPGEQAAYVRATVAGIAGVDTCFAYLGQDGSAWAPAAVACGRGSAFAPAVGATLSVGVPGGCANLRASPGSTGLILVCLASGTPVSLTGPPLFRDGHIWWPATADRVAGDIALDAFSLS